MGPEDRKYDVQGRTNGGLGIESRRRIVVCPKNRTRVRSLELVLHEVVTNKIAISFKIRVRVRIPVSYRLSLILII